MTTELLTSADDLDAFVRTAKGGGVPDDALVPLLKQNGWSQRRIYRSLSAWYGTSLGVTPPSRSAGDDGARDAFYYLLNFITLGMWTVAVGQIFYVLIQHAFPDYSYQTQTLYVQDVAWQLATIIVVFPVFVFIHRSIKVQLQRRPDRADSGVRLWLTYVTLVIAAVVVLGDGIWFLNGFLRGELTVRFVLDSLVLLTLGGGVFAYYITTIRRPGVTA
jgi:Domain of unknown function (DUF5671)